MGIDAIPLTPDEVMGKLCKEKFVYLWVKENGFTYKPVCCKKIIGDGMQFVFLSSIDHRPHAWYVRIDSATDIEADNFDAESLIFAVEDEFGSYDDEEDCLFNGEEYREWEYPLMDWSGGSWGLKYNCKTGENNLNS